VVVRRVLQPESVDTLTEILRSVVTEGTGRKAAVPGYVVAGKTGTAQKVDASGRYSMVDHVASFVGFLPASRPALVILASLDSPRGAANQGGDVAAPLFARVAEGALRILAVSPDDPGRVLRAVATAPESVVPAAFRPQGPARPVLAPPPPEEGPGLMPDLRGRSAREAAIAAARRGLVVELHGSGLVVAQSPEPGAEIEPGNTCVLTLGRQEARP
jgi:membrane peptidoglycan carboxypeptidase